MIYNAMRDIQKQYCQEKLESFETSTLTPKGFANYSIFFWVRAPHESVWGKTNRII